MVWEEAYAAHVEHLDLEPLEPLEERSVVLRFSTEGDLAFVGRVVSGTRLDPVGSAVVTLRQGARTLDEIHLEPDDGGVFGLLTDSWRNPYLRIEAPSFSPVLVPVEAGHATEEEARVITLRRTAALLVTVLDAGLVAVPEVGVLAEARPLDLVDPDEVEIGESERFLWVAETGETGRCILQDLPAGAPLRIEGYGDPFGYQRESVEIVLAPEEVRRLEIRILPPGRLDGRLVDRAGTPVAHKEIWLVRTEAGATYMNCETHRGGRAAFSDSDGRFTYLDVYAGAYLLGPCPACPRTHRGTASAGNPRAHGAGGRLRSPSRIVTTGAGELELVLGPVRGRITGRVVTPEEPYPLRALVRAAGPGRKPVNVFVDPVTGDFVLDHLTPGTYTVSASAGKSSGSQRVTLDSRDGNVRNVILRLEKGGTLFVQTDVDAWWTCEVFRQGEVVVEEHLRGRRSRALEVPAGRLAVRLTRRDTGKKNTLRVTLRSGEPQRVSFELE